MAHCYILEVPHAFSGMQCMSNRIIEISKYIAGTLATLMLWYQYEDSNATRATYMLLPRCTSCTWLDVVGTGYQFRLLNFRQRETVQRVGSGPTPPPCLCAASVMR